MNLTKNFSLFDAFRNKFRTLFKSKESQESQEIKNSNNKIKHIAIYKPINTSKNDFYNYSFYKNMEYIRLFTREVNEKNKLKTISDKIIKKNIYDSKEDLYYDNIDNYKENNFKIMMSVLFFGGFSIRLGFQLYKFFSNK
jgi:hypothetical protein